jgi:hypothetical protein
MCLYDARRVGEILVGLRLDRAGAQADIDDPVEHLVTPGGKGSTLIHECLTRSRSLWIEAIQSNERDHVPMGRVIGRKTGARFS